MPRSLKVCTCLVIKPSCLKPPCLGQRQLLVSAAISLAHCCLPCLGEEDSTGQLKISWAVFVSALVKVFQQRPEPRSPTPASNILLPSRQVTVHFDTILTRNNKLREEIENLRIQKAILDNCYLKLRKKLDQQRRRMNTAVEQTAQAYEQRYVAL